MISEISTLELSWQRNNVMIYFTPPVIDVRRGAYVVVKYSDD